MIDDSGATQLIDPALSGQWSVNISDTDTRNMAEFDVVLAYSRGELDPNDVYVWREGMDDWIPLGQCGPLMAAVQQYQQGQAGGGYQQPQASAPQGYEQAGYDQAGYDPAGYDQAGYDQAGYDQAGYDQAGYDQAGYDQAGYDQAGYGAQPDYQQSAAQEGYAGHGAAAGYATSAGGGYAADENPLEATAFMPEGAHELAQAAAQASSPSVPPQPHGRRVGERDEASMLFSLDQLGAVSPNKNKNASDNADPFDLGGGMGGGGFASAFAPPHDRCGTAATTRASTGSSDAFNGPGCNALCRRVHGADGPRESQKEQDRARRGGSGRGVGDRGGRHIFRDEAVTFGAGRRAGFGTDR